MSNDKPHKSYEIFTTRDGSPTLSLAGGEKMHSMEGALSETQYIYAPCVESALGQSSPWILSMGLGLGYNELMALSQLDRAGIRNFQILSFESVPFLRHQFLKWAQDEADELGSCYQQVLERTAETYNLAPENLKERLKTSLMNNQLKIFEALEKKNPLDQKFHSILYDAFSSETDSSLWEESHFLNFLDEYASKDFCCLTTYAATGKLKRALKARDFTFEKRSGFGMKRESTLATRSSEEG